MGRTSRLDSTTWRRIRRLVLARASWCLVCGGEASHVDHVEPLWAGGSNDLENLQPLCWACHMAKTAREAVTAAATRRPPRGSRPPRVPDDEELKVRVFARAVLRAWRRAGWHCPSIGDDGGSCDQRHGVVYAGGREARRAHALRDVVGRGALEDLFRVLQHDPWLVASCREHMPVGATVVWEFAMTDALVKDAMSGRWMTTAQIRDRLLAEWQPLITLRDEPFVVLFHGIVELQLALDSLAWRGEIERDPDVHGPARPRRRRRWRLMPS